MKKPKLIYLVIIVLLVKAILLIVLFSGFGVTARFVADQDENIQTDSEEGSLIKDKILSSQDEDKVDILPAKAYELKENYDLVVLDVRTPNEFFSQRIQGAVNLDSNSINLKENLDKLERDNVYLVYCRTDTRSTQIANLMDDMGFENIYRLEGGIVSWQKQGLPVV
ncbi:MAG: rhodanese-like domain-containing protein [Candidatus Nanoarchaeia archaeon]